LTQPLRLRPARLSQSRQRSIVDYDDSYWSPPANGVLWRIDLSGTKEAIVDAVPAPRCTAGTMNEEHHCTVSDSRVGASVAFPYLPGPLIWSNFTPASPFTIRQSQMSIHREIDT